MKSAFTLTEKRMDLICRIIKGFLSYSEWSVRNKDLREEAESLYIILLKEQNIKQAIKRKQKDGA